MIKIFKHDVIVLLFLHFQILHINEDKLGKIILIWLQYLFVSTKMHYNNYIIIMRN